MFRVKPTIEKSLRKEGRLAPDETLLAALATELVSENRGPDAVHENERLSVGPVRLKVGKPVGLAYTDSKLWIIGALGIAGCAGGIVHVVDARRTEPKVLDLLLAFDPPRRWRLKMTEDEAGATADQLMELRQGLLTELSGEDRTHCLLVHADTFGRLGETAEALRLYQEAMIAGGSREQVARAELNAGISTKKLGDTEAAESHFRRAMSDPSGEVGGRAAANLGLICKERGDLRPALRYFERSRQRGFPAADLGIGAVREAARQAGLTWDDDEGPETTNPPE